jgi:hypothetical protein
VIKFNITAKNKNIQVKAIHPRKGREDPEVK